MLTMRGRNRYLGFRNFRAFRMWKFMNGGGVGVVEPLTDEIRRNQRVLLMVRNRHQRAKMRWEDLQRTKSLLGYFTYQFPDI